MEALKNPLVAAVVAAIITLAAKFIDARMNKKEFNPRDYTKCILFNAVLVGFFVYMTSGVNPVEEILTEPF